MTEPTTWNEAIENAGDQILRRTGMAWLTHEEMTEMVREEDEVWWEALGQTALGTLADTPAKSRRVMKEITDLCVWKQTDYGHDNINAYGQLGLRVRASDKLARIKNMDGKPGVAEPARDAWVDLVGYSLIGLMLEAGTFDLELAEPEPASAPPWVQLDIYEELP